jgi:protein TonB
MLNEKILRLILFLVVAAVHIILLLFVVFNVEVTLQKPPESARVMRVTDLSEIPPAPPPPPPPPEVEQSELPMVESIAETMIETEVAPEQIVVDPGTVITPGSVSDWGDYLPIHSVSQAPVFDVREIMSALVYPPIALRSGIEGRVILELFVDRSGVIQQIRILQENPPDRGFGEAAVKAFTGRRGVPAHAEGLPVSTRYRYPVRFEIKQ